jgi:hypothetical protein
MNREIKDNVEGWDISFNRNVHMYCHALSVKKGQYQIGIDCEDLPTTEKTIGIWLHKLDVSNELKDELRRILLRWANKFEIKFQIYVSQDEFITNVSW